MAKGNLAACLAVTLPHEGGYVDHPKDPGGATNMGITLATLSSVRGRKVTKAEVKALTRSEAMEIYRRNYWTVVRGEHLPAGVDLTTFDFGVNSGNSRAAKYLQSAVGVTQDGVIGTATLAAVAKRDAKAIVRAVNAKRLSFLKGLSTFSTFGRGWSRRVADVEAKSLAMAGASSHELASDAEEASKAAKGQGAAANASGGAGAVVGGAGAGFEFGDLNLMVVLGVVGVAVVIFAMLRSRANINADRAHALKLASMSVDAEPAM